MIAVATIWLLQISLPKLQKLLYFKRFCLCYFLDEIELLANWGPIAFLIFMPVFMWCLDNKGLRLSSVSTAFLVALGTGLRCLPLDAALLR